MSKTILITGSTDGIGLEAAKKFLQNGNTVLLHGRDDKKLKKIKDKLSKVGNVESYKADLSDLDEVRSLARDVSKKHTHLDVLINNAGVFKTSNTATKIGIDTRFVVNTIAPYLLTQSLIPILDNGRVINMSSAAQSPVELNALNGMGKNLADMEAYSQSKLGITMWSFYLSKNRNLNDPIFIALNPGSLLATKMVKEGFGVEGHNINIGADITIKAAISSEFDCSNGRYYDNDAQSFASPHLDALNKEKCASLVAEINKIVN